MNAVLVGQFALYGIAAIGATLLLTCLRRFPLGFSAVLCVGAYVAACSKMSFGCHWLAALSLGALAGAGVAWAVAVLDRLLIGDEYAVLWWMLTLAAYEAVSALEVTGGQHSLVGIPPLFTGYWGLQLTSTLLLLIFLGLLVLLWRFRATQTYDEACLSGFDPSAIERSGQDPKWVSMKLHLLAGLIGGLAGALWGPFYQSLHPGQFGLSESVVILLICLLGKPGDPLGILLGLLLVLIAPNLLDLGFATPGLSIVSQVLGFAAPDPAAVVGSLYQAFLGLLLVVTMVRVSRERPLTPVMA